MNKPGAPTLADVARMAGVSTASISRALNEPDKVAESTREKIKHAIDTLGYTPHFGGRALASRRTNTVGAVIPSMANAMLANGLQAFQEQLAREGVTLLVATTGFDPQQELAQIKALVARGADGLLLIGNDRPAETWEFLDKRDVPHVISWIDQAREGHFFVGFDNARAAGTAAQAALDMGHRRIGVIAGETYTNDRALARLQGVRDTVAAFGQGARLTHVVESPYKLDDAAAAFRQIMAQPDLPTVVICANDAQAAGAMSAARDMGMTLPQDMSFVGFDDIGLARVVWPSLSTVRVPQVDMGQGAARLLLAMLAGESTLQSQRLETKFIARGSLMPPAKA